MNKEIYIKERKHQGHLLQSVIRKLGIKVKDAALHAKISRGTLYNYFKQEKLEPKVLLRLGSALRYDFSLHFPALIPLKENTGENNVELYGKRTTEELSMIQRKYYRALEKHNALLEFLVKLCADYEIDSMKEKLSQFKPLKLSNDIDQKPF